MPVTNAAQHRRELELMRSHTAVSAHALGPPSLELVLLEARNAAGELERAEVLGPDGIPLEPEPALEALAAERQRASAAELRATNAAIAVAVAFVADGGASVSAAARAGRLSRTTIHARLEAPASAA